MQGRPNCRTRNKKKKSANKCKNKTLGLIFEKESTRTRVSFTVGFQKLGGNALELNTKSIGFNKRESAQDILRTLTQFIDLLVIRNNDHKLIKKLRALNSLPIINGLSDYSHPCQILSDMFTINENIGNIKNKQITWVGDYNNVLISFIQAQHLYSFQLNIVMPKPILGRNIFTINKTPK